MFDIDNFWKGHTGKLKKKPHVKMRIWDLFSYLKNTYQGCIKVLLQDWYSAWNTSSPPPPQVAKGPPNHPLAISKTPRLYVKLQRHYSDILTRFPSAISQHSNQNILITVIDGPQGTGWKVLIIHFNCLAAHGGQPRGTQKLTWLWHVRTWSQVR